MYCMPRFEQLNRGWRQPNQVDPTERRHRLTTDCLNLLSIEWIRRVGAAAIRIVCNLTVKSGTEAHLGVGVSVMF